MFVEFFIKRPVFATVCAIIIVLVGAIALPTLPVAQYPDISPPQVTVTANYNGANSEVVENTVTNVLERQLNGIEGVKYITSTSSNDGTSNIVLTFDLGRSKDIAAVDVQNKVSVAQSQLPTEVIQTGVTISKEANNIVLAMGLFSENNTYDDIFLSNYADLYVTDALKRLKGVGNVRIFGERKYSMRMWLDPAKLASRSLTVKDVTNALNEQNLQVGAGQIGQPPAPDGQQFQLTVRAVGRLKEPSEFADIVIKTETDGTLVKFKDVGRVELGAENYGSFLRFNGKKGVGIGIYQIPGSNSLDVAHEVKKQMEVLAQKFPPGMKYQVAFDTTLYVEESLAEVAKTLLEAIALVVLVIFVFLQNWQSTVIPAITIPVSLIGTFIFIKAFNFSTNSLTLFGLTLATGLVVDDAIVVIENISRCINEKGMNPVEAAIEAMNEVFGAVIATSLVLMAVFVPVAFFPGTTGQLYKQFALTIAFSVAISTFNAVTLTPALSALLLKPNSEGNSSSSQNFVFRGINWVLEKIRRGYESSLYFLNKFKGIVLILFIGLLALTAWLFTFVPAAFLPEEDQGYFITVVQAPEGVSLGYTSKAIDKAVAIIQGDPEKPAIPEVVGTFALGGFSFAGNSPNSGVIFTTLKPWSERKRPDQSLGGIINNLRGKLLSIPDALVLPFAPPAIQGLGSIGGFQFELQDRANVGLDNLDKAAKDIITKGDPSRGLIALRTSFNNNTPQLLIEVDRNKAKSLQVSLQDIFQTLQVFLGSSFVNDFNLFERTYRVYVQADSQFRSSPNDIGSFYVRSQTGTMIPLSNLVKVTPTVGPQTISHYNLFRSIEINGLAAPGVSSGQAIQSMQNIAKEVLPQGVEYEWSGISLEEITSGGQAPIIFALGLVFVFLVLAAQYESYVDPLIIMLTVPLAILGALSAQLMRGFANDVYCQIGLVLLIGLSSKNAILIVEFANQLRDRGFPIVKAAIEAAQERLRPILMTALAFILGIFPLVNATGAGAASRQSLGTAVFGGMIVSTLLGLFLVPILYIIFGKVQERFKRNPERNPDYKALQSVPAIEVHHPNKSDEE